MARSTGIVLTATAVTFANDWYVTSPHVPNFRVIVAGLVAALGTAAVERVSPNLGVGLASILLVTTVLAPVSATQTPMQSLLKITKGNAS
jgi:hypothetical protein